MMKHEIKKLSIIDAGKIFALIGLITGLFLAGIVYLNTTLVIKQLANPLMQQQIVQSGSDTQTLLIYWQTIRKTALIIPLLSVVISFLFGLVFSLVYNLMTRVWGGLRIEFVERQAKK